MALFMNPAFTKLILASGLTLTMAQFSPFILAEASSQNIADVTQSVQISTAYTLSPFLRAHDIQVSVNGDKATLSGKVAAEINKDLATQIALGVTGIKDVDNQISIDKNFIASKSEEKDRSFGQIVDDATITASIRSKLLWSKFAEGLSTDVDTSAGKVNFSGYADSDIAKELAGRLALNTQGVTDVDNQLKVIGEKPAMAENAKKSLDSVGQSISDTWITTKVKSTLLYSSNVNSSQISVSTDQGHVTLSGKVGSGAERALAIEIAQNVRGARSVSAEELAD